ncbi:UNVERIFIED_CONTAM: hypothetical protein K2H54_028026 [Gekko kuhli]
MNVQLSLENGGDLSVQEQELMHSDSRALHSALQRPSLMASVLEGGEYHRAEHALATSLHPGLSFGGDSPTAGAGNSYTTLTPAPAAARETTVLSSQLEEINTKEVAQRIIAELKRYSIPQAIFAERVLCRSQGTLSDLLRNPKPWSKLKSGRETFKRMWRWLQEPEFQRMAALRTMSTLRSW